MQTTLDEFARSAWNLDIIKTLLRLYLWHFLIAAPPSLNLVLIILRAYKNYIFLHEFTTDLCNSSKILEIYSQIWLLKILMKS